MSNLAQISVERRRAIVGELVVRGIASSAKIQVALLEKHNISASIDAVRTDLRALKATWREHQRSAYEETVAAELLKLNQLEWEAWEAWERSKSDKVITTTTVNGEKTVVETRDGDHRHLDTLLRVTEKRQALLGLDGEARAQTPAAHAGVKVDDLSNVELAAVMDGVLGRREEKQGKRGPKS